MSSESDNFYAATGGDEFRFLNHNETDFESFREFQASLDKKFAKIEQENTRRERISHLKKWDSNLSPRFRGASLTKIKSEAAVKALSIISENGAESFFITGNPGSGKTYLGYSILRRYIGAGFATPSQVKIISEETIMSYAMTGFEGRAKFDELFNPKYKMYLLDNVGSKESYDSRREIPFWEQLIEHIYTNSLTAVFTSNESPNSFAGILNESGNSKFRHLIKDRLLTVKGNRTPELEDPEAESRSVKSEPKTVLDHFEG